MYKGSMGNELAKAETTEPALPVSEDIVVLARDPEEMAEAQKGLIGWMDRKVASLKVELAEAEENLATAQRMKHRTDGWKRVVRQVERRVIYYEKARTALDEGYCIIPEFPVQVVAVRTTKKKPPRKWHKGGAFSVPAVKAENLPAGEGEYVDPDPIVKTVTLPRGPEDRYDKHQSRAIELQDVDFPFKKVKPQILKGLEAAVKRKLFDEIGILPATRRGGDPVLVGRIKRKESAYNEPTLTFLIAWWIDTSDL